MPVTPSFLCSAGSPPWGGRHCNGPIEISVLEVTTTVVLQSNTILGIIAVAAPLGVTGMTSRLCAGPTTVVMYLVVERHSCRNESEKGILITIELRRAPGGKSSVKPRPSRSCCRLEPMSSRFRERERNRSGRYDWFSTTRLRSRCMIGERSTDQI